MHRLFVAIQPPAAVRAWLLGLTGGVSGARWQVEDQLHLTVRFIGEVDRHAAADVDAALAGLVHPPFEARIAGVGSFERRGAPTALWAGVSPPEPFQALHKKVDQAIVRAGLEPERRAYVPHITLARLPRGSGSLGGFLDAAGSASGPSFPVTDFCLFESRLTPDGAAYSVVERYRLG
ncbi:MAG: RNA 2',3'-cyclic phosphodiesterase [Alphaproteobacteria bacterium]|nr:RNA 2',3'-cyclic phosphodiesterase [Alphaproteobacteria bacterium]